MNEISKLGRSPATRGRAAGLRPQPPAASSQSGTPNAERYGPPGVHTAFAALPSEVRAEYPHAAIIRWFQPGSYFVFGMPGDAVDHFTSARWSA